ncbi:hypothetical protein [Niallia sp. MER 6]|uniref:hypothetical protein n=1 Tax=Niallia sp. MER 6 TaxID=2939567 RepID=UPI00203CA7BF|nr:hypothetical protein [Niallia sp. MER 6]MCM3034240.1 hypothetical protein [Niallia sp. MER 6]
MFTTKNYMNTFLTSLDNHTEVLTNKLKEIQTYQFSPTIDLIDFVVFMDQSTFSIRMFSMDRDNNEVFKEEGSPLFAGSEEIISDVECSYISDKQLDDFYSFYEQNEEELVPKEEKAIAEWFQNCWKDVGFDTLELPSYFVFHDAFQSFDLTAWKWMEEEEKWS